MTGKIVVTPQFNEGDYMAEYRNGLILTSKGRLGKDGIFVWRTGYLDRSGKYVWPPSE
jgi:hypothetical protein